MFLSSFDRLVAVSVCTFVSPLFDYAIVEHVNPDQARPVFSYTAFSESGICMLNSEDVLYRRIHLRLE